MRTTNLWRIVLGTCLVVAVAFGAEVATAGCGVNCGATCGPDNNGACEINAENCDWCSSGEEPDGSCWVEYGTCETVDCDCDAGSGWECYEYAL